jgi:hypothetical protein
VPEKIPAASNERLAMALMLAAPDEPLPVIPCPENKNFTALRSFFANGGVLLSRDEPDFAVALKGGNNDEPHNHNDVGSFSVVVGTNMVICDPGGEVYTKRTFSAQRYDSKVLNSFGHDVPVIAGKLQKTGAAARGIILASDFTEAADTLTLDIRSAYSVPNLKKLERTFVFQRGAAPSLTVRDEIKISAPESFETALVTWGEIKIISPNLVEISDGGSTVRVTIDTQGKPFQLRQEQIDEDVQSKRKPFRLALALDGKITEAAVTLKIVPVK